MRKEDRGRTRRRRAEKTLKNETLLLETRSFRAEGLCRGHAAPPFSVPHYDFPHKTGGGRRRLRENLVRSATAPYSSVFFRRVARRLGFSSTGASIFTPANSGSIMMRPQYSQTMIFLRMRISSCR